MALDLNTLGENSNKADVKKVTEAIGPVAAILTNFDDLVRLYGSDEMLDRLNRALPILQGRSGASTDEQIETLFAGLTQEDKRFIRRVIAGEISIPNLEAELHRLTVESRQRGSVNVSQGLSQAITASATSVASVAEVERLTSEVARLQEEAYEATKKANEAIPEDDDIKAVGVRGGKIKEWRKLTSEALAKQELVRTKVVELTNAVTDAANSARNLQAGLSSSQPHNGAPAQQALG